MKDSPIETSVIEERSDLETEAAGRLANMRGRIFGRGEAVLRIARRRARRSGDSDLVDKLDSLLADQETAAIAGVALEDEAGGGGLLRDIFRWIAENPEAFKDLIQFLFDLFSGVSAVPEAA